MMAKNRRAAVLLVIAAAALAAALLRGPVAQDPAYHRFADARPWAGVPNFGDVASNVPFLIVGLYGLSRIRRLARLELAAAYGALCAGVALVSLGSTYYHLNPSNPTLLWDRLPMTIAFMALFSMLLEERVLENGGTFVPLLAAGLASAVYWHWTEQRGAGDLRPYLIVQFLPMLLMPLILALYPAKYLRNDRLAAALILYAAAKFFEACDRPTFAALGFVSGHTIKHLLAAGGALCIILAVPAKEVPCFSVSERPSTP